jgi:ABC-type multidrug transport system fused ATPase/permease subunit
MNKFFSKLSSPIQIIKIIAKHEPLYLIYAFPQIILNAGLPLLYVYFPKLIIEQLTSNNDYNDIIKTISIYVGILLFINVTNAFLKNKSGLRADLFSKGLKNEIGKISMKLELKDIESPESKDMIQMASKASELTNAMGLVQSIISNIITIIGLVYIVVRLDWLFIILIFITLSVKIIFVRLQYNKSIKIRKLQIENSRYVEYLLNLSYFNEGGAKEIRLNSLQNWYMDKTKLYRNEMVSIHFSAFKLGAIHNIITEIFLTLQSFVILWLLSQRFINGVISIAEFSMYFTAVATLTISLSSITEQFGNYSQQVLNASDYKKFMRVINDQNEIATNSVKTIIPEKTEIIFQDVSFTYPNTNKEILKKINLKIIDKEKLVIVGMNGAGKSTFIKLLCKFYRPTKGKIMLNGIDIWNIPNDEYYQSISAVFQDFTNFSFSLQENISMSEETEFDKITKIINNIGLKERVEELPNGLDTCLSKNFDSSGVEFSGGQAQKIAIARAIYKDTPILILDEPTASLDPKAESEIYSDFFNMAKDKTTIFISHRLAASTIASNIAVFSNGEIVEYGTHKELIKINGIYTQMYHRQSSQYSDAILNN